MRARLRSMVIRIFGSLFRHSSDHALDEELQSHLEMATEWRLRQGLNPEQARHQAFLAFGGLEQIKENYRDQRGLPLLGNGYPLWVPAPDR